MKLQFSILFIMALLNCRGVIRAQTDCSRLKSIEIYLDFDEGGHTTAGAIGYFNELKNKNMEIITMSEDDVKMIRDVVKQAKRKKYHQTKHGGNMAFCNFIYDSDISKTGISVSDERAVITDFTAQTLYIVNDSKHLIWIADFLESLRGQR